MFPGDTDPEGAQYSWRAQSTRPGSFRSVDPAPDLKTPHHTLASEQDPSEQRVPSSSFYVISALRLPGGPGVQALMTTGRT